MERKSLKENVTLSVLKVVLNIVFPLISFPYIARVLQVETLGKINYANSIVNYFALVAGLGITTYAVREGARIRDHQDKISAFSSQILTINVITTLIAYLLLGVCLGIVNSFRNNRLLIWMYSISIICTTFGVEWINTIYEEYRYILIRSLIVQTISLALTFIFVRSQSDYYIYACIGVGSQMLISLFNIVHIRKYVKLRITLRPKVATHIKPMLVFFASNMAISIYLSSDTTMLGLIAGDYYTGIYAVAVRVYTMVKTVLNTIYTVAIPRLTQFYGNGDENNYKETINKLITFIVFLLFPVSVQMMVQADGIVRILSGESYMDASVTICILAWALICAVFSGILITCINVTRNNEMLSLKATFLGAILNVILNLIMIPMMRHNGAAITTLLAELAVVCYCLIRDRSILSIIDQKRIALQLKDTLIGVLPMLLVSIVIRKWISMWLASCVISVGFGLLLYMAILMIRKNSLALELVKSIKIRFRILFIHLFKKV